MRFSAEHTFPGPVDRVSALMTDPEFVRTVVLPDLSPPVIVGHSRDESAATVSVRYVYMGQLDPVARRLLGNRELALVQTVQLDLKAHSGSLRLEAEADPSRLHGDAQITITPGTSPATSRRRLAGDFTVKVPLMGSTVERRLLPGILARFDVEAAALASRLHEM